MTDDDKDNNLDKVAEGEDKLGLPHKASPKDIRQGKKKKDLDALGDILARIKVPPQLIRNDKDADDLV